ncbi:hypothetical protein PYCC9005_003539 [Savitreella phatthalungensis]
MSSEDLLQQARPYLDNAVARVRTLPPFTLGVTCVMGLVVTAGLLVDIVAWFSLAPSNIWSLELSRLTTYPLAHLGLLHFLINLIAFLSLCARFEARHGTLRSLTMFLGPFESVPGLIYCFIEGAIFRKNTAIVGCSGWIFVLLAIESKTELTLSGRRIPGWAVPLILVGFAALLLPGSSLFGHLAAVATGFVFGTGKVDFVLLPLGVCNFVEQRILAVVLGYVPRYVTAEQAMKNAQALPDLEAAPRPRMTRAATTSLGHASRSNAD